MTPPSPARIVHVLLAVAATAVVLAAGEDWRVGHALPAHGVGALS